MLPREAVAARRLVVEARTSMTRPAPSSQMRRCRRPRPVVSHCADVGLTSWSTPLPETPVVPYCQTMLAAE